MRNLLMATTAASLVFLVNVAGAPAADVPAPVATTATAATSVDIQALIGRKVVDTSNATIGKVSSVLVGNDGKASFVIVDVGGWLGMGGREVAVRWDQLTFADDNERITLDTTKERLAALPAHRYSDPSLQGKVYAYSDDVKANPYLADDAGAMTVPAATVDLKKLIGRSVSNGRETVGDINSVITDKAGKVRYVVVGVGGFLGMGEREVALAWNELTISTDGEKVTANVTKEQLKALPAYRFADSPRRGTVHVYDEDLKANTYLANDPAQGTATDTMAAKMPPLAGANSFTESQARTRIENSGFTAVTNLMKDDQSIWRGQAMKDGKSVNVALDYKGNVVVD